MSHHHMKWLTTGFRFADRVEHASMMRFLCINVAPNKEFRSATARAHYTFADRSEHHRHVTVERCMCMRANNGYLKFVYLQRNIGLAERPRFYARSWKRVPTSSNMVPAA
jgi:hypothetical protein